MSSSFTGELTLTHPDKDCKWWLLGEPFSYALGFKESGLLITAPAGFATDGATIPRPFWSVFTPLGVLLRAAITHDFLYTCLSNGTPHPLAPTRAAADKVLREAAIVAGLSKPSAWIVWASVRIFGAKNARTKRSADWPLQSPASSRP